jgi:hypothetical protein
MKVPAVTLGTRLGAPSAVWRLEAPSALTTSERSHRAHDYWTSSKKKHFGLEQGAGDFVPRAFDKPAERLARDAHSLGGRLEVQTLLVGEPQGLQLVETKLNRLKLAARHTGRLERPDGRLSGDEPTLAGTRHGLETLDCCNEHMLIMPLCQVLYENFIRVSCWCAEIVGAQETPGHAQ